MDTEERLRAHGLRATPQRVATYETLMAHGAHLTADGLHARVRRRMPTTSLGTVYRVLRNLVSAGMVRAFDAGGGPGYFDANLDGHHHLACVRCGAVVDVRPRGLRDLRLPARERRGYALVGEPELVFRGLCPSCARGETG